MKKNKYLKILKTIFPNKKIFLSNIIDSFNLYPDNCWFKWIDINNCGFEIDVDSKKIKSIHNLNNFKNPQLLNSNYINNILDFAASGLIDTSNFDLWIMTCDFKLHHYQYINDSYNYNYIFNNNIGKVFLFYKYLYRTIFYKNFSIKDKNIIVFKFPIFQAEINKLKTINENSYNRIFNLLEKYVSP